MIDEAPSPDLIRRRTVELMEPHKARLFDLMEGIFAAHGEDRRFRDDWPQVRRHALFDPLLAGRGARDLIAAHNQRIVEAVRHRRPLPAPSDG